MITLLLVFFGVFLVVIVVALLPHKQTNATGRSLARLHDALDACFPPSESASRVAAFYASWDAVQSDQVAPAARCRDKTSGRIVPCSALNSEPLPLGSEPLRRPH